jgi:class 3 adenylate cyclase
MMIFNGPDRAVRAIKVALKAQWIMTHILEPKARTQWQAVSSKDIKLRCVTGIDVGEVTSVKAGIKTASDLVWVGRAPNLAAKLSGVRDREYGTVITADTHKQMMEYCNGRFARRAPDATWHEHTFSFVGLKVDVLCSYSELAP